LSRRQNNALTNVTLAHRLSFRLAAKYIRKQKHVKTFAN